MQKKVVLTLFILLVIILGGILSSLLSVDDSRVEVANKYLSPVEKKDKENLKIRSWAESLANVDKANFSYPVNELFMQIELKKYIPPKVKSYKLVVDKADRYSIFCILQTISSMNFPFVLEKVNRIPTIYVSSKTKEDLLKIVKKLKEYDIESKIIEVWL